MPVIITYSSRHLPIDVTGEEESQSAIEELAVVDTGAHRTVIREDIAKNLNLRPLGEVELVVASGEVIDSVTYLITLMIPGGVTKVPPDGREDSSSIVFEHDQVASVPREQVAGCLLGMDILKHCEFHYDGPKNYYSFGYSENKEYSTQNHISVIPTRVQVPE